MKCNENDTVLNVKQVDGLHGAYMVWVCVGCVVQDYGLGEIPPEDAEIFDVVAENTGTIFLVQAMSTREK